MKDTFCTIENKIPRLYSLSIKYQPEYSSKEVEDFEEVIFYTALIIQIQSKVELTKANPQNCKKRVVRKSLAGKKL